MIGKLRVKFFLICAISVFAVITLIFVLISTLSYNLMNQSLDTLTDSISEGNGRFPESFGDKIPPFNKHNSRPIPDFINDETKYSTRHFTVWLDQNGQTVKSNTDFIHSISKETAEEYARNALSSSKTRGWISNYRYKVYSDKSSTAVVFVDGTVNKSMFANSLIIIVTVLLSSAFVILLLIFLLSGKAMKPVAESYEKQKQFITDANHELKTPLTLILTNLDIAESELGQNEWLSDIREEGNRMTELVNQLVALSRMDEEKQTLNLCDIYLGKLIYDTVSEFEHLAQNKGKIISADIDQSIIYHGDQSLLTRLIGILMDNAIKYCDNDGEIKIAFTKRKHCTLTIENSYATVEEIEINKLFDRFYRADKARTFTGGYGIGLSIAKAIVEKHNGEITAYKKNGNTIGFKVVLK